MEIQGYSLPDDLYYDPEHYWIKVEGDLLVMGMNDFARQMAGDIVYVQLPFVGKKLEAGKKFAKVESGKWVGKVMAPVSGQLAAVNTNLETSPKLINQDCYGAGWMYKIKPDNVKDVEKLLHGTAAVEKWLLAEIEKHKKT
ncbi:MAG: glycine cleavage system protein GcvH [Thermodesulfobacteriota bacterium]